VEALDDRIVPTVNVTNRSIGEVLNNPPPVLPGQNLQNFLMLVNPAQPNPNQNDPIANDPNNPFHGFNLNQLFSLYNTLVEGLGDAADLVQLRLNKYNQALTEFQNLVTAYPALLQLGGGTADALLYQAVVKVNLAAESALESINHYNALVGQVTALQDYLYSLMANGTTPAIDLGDEPEPIEVELFFIQDQNGFRPGIDGRVYA
jgi:hypothetical protein